jgi:hypothetical protein
MTRERVRLLELLALKLAAECPSELGNGWKTIRNRLPNIELPTLIAGERGCLCWGKDNGDKVIVEAREGKLRTFAIREKLTLLFDYLGPDIPEKAFPLLAEYVP